MVRYLNIQKPFNESPHIREPLQRINTCFFEFIQKPFHFKKKIHSLFYNNLILFGIIVELFRDLLSPKKRLAASASAKVTMADEIIKENFTHWNDFLLQFRPLNLQMSPPDFRPIVFHAMPKVIRHLEDTFDRLIPCLWHLVSFCRLALRLGCIQYVAIEKTCKTTLCFILQVFTIATVLGK